MYRVLMFVLCVCSLSSCSSTRPDDELPVVNVSYFKPLPMQGLAPVFEVGLHIINPAASTLALNGLSYTIKLEGQRVLVGVARDLPAIPAYSERDAVVRASTDMVGSFLFITRLMQEKQGNIHYEFSASLDVAGLKRNIKVVKAGEISFGGKQNRPD